MVTTQNLLCLGEDNLAKPLVKEEDFYTEWCSQFDLDWSPEETAFAGGLISDKLAFFFISAYQAAIQRTFGKNNRHWTALAISEDRGAQNPPMRIILKQDRIQNVYFFKGNFPCVWNILYAEYIVIHRVACCD